MKTRTWPSLYHTRYFGQPLNRYEVRQHAITHKPGVFDNFAVPPCFYQVCSTARSAHLLANAMNDLHYKHLELALQTQPPPTEKP